MRRFVVLRALKSSFLDVHRVDGLGGESAFGPCNPLRSMTNWRQKCNKNRNSYRYFRAILSRQHAHAQFVWHNFNSSIDESIRCVSVCVCACAREPIRMTNQNNRKEIADQNKFECVTINWMVASAEGYTDKSDKHFTVSFTAMHSPHQMLAHRMSGVGPTKCRKNIKFVSMECKSDNSRCRAKLYSIVQR